MLRSGFPDHASIRKNVLQIASDLGIKNQTMRLLISGINITLEGINMADNNILEYCQFRLNTSYAVVTYQIIVLENFTPGSIVSPSASLAGLIASTARILAAANHELPSAR
jgi:hypothetical protein